jgi:hypothetical protein
LSESLTRKVLAELCYDRVFGESSVKLPLDFLSAHIVLLLKSHEKL